MCVCVIASPIPRWFLSREVRRGEGSTYVCHSRGCGLLSQVVAMNTILSLCVSVIFKTELHLALPVKLIFCGLFTFYRTGAISNWPM